MAFDEGLAHRIREQFSGCHNIAEKKMFGGLCFMVNDHMCVGIVKDTLMARVGPKNYVRCLRKKHVREMDFTGKPLKGMVYVEPKGFELDSELKEWINLCVLFVNTLPPKQPKKK